MKKILTFGGALIFLGIAWHLSSWALDKAFLPTPAQALTALGEALGQGDLSRHFVISLGRVLASLGLGLLLAVPLGLFLGRNPAWDRFMAPLIYLLYPLPKMVFLPIIVVLWGLGNWPKIFLITLVVFFQILVVVRDAAKNLAPGQLQIMRVLNANVWQTYRHLIWPYCLPKILTSLRITSGTAISVLFFAETFASQDGLGYFILNGMETRNYPAMYGGIILLAFLGLLLYWLIDGLESYFCRWQKL